MPERFFNTAGPIRRDDHYCLDPLGRFSLDEVLALIAQKKYFVLHAPRQTGKTSCLLALMEHLNQSGEYRALYANVEGAQGAREDVHRGVRAILGELADRAEFHLDDAFLAERHREILESLGEDKALNQALTAWAQSSPKPTVLMIDEIDSLVGDTLISVLRQIRSGYDKRPESFPQTVILCGVRDVRDYRIHSDAQKAVITGGSAFNIKAASLRLGNFSEEEVYQLLGQHPEATGQVFEPEALGQVWALTSGQPWLVNALAYEACFQMKENRDRSRPITGETITEAKENLILRRETHLDQLADKLSEDRVRRVIEPILVGEEHETGFRQQDVEYVTDLGLVRQERNGATEIANRIYAEIISRELTWNAQMGMALQTAWYVSPAGRLDLEKLLSAFQEFFREHSEHWVERFDYKAAGPQLLMQAYLQRVVNSGGRVEREYGLGRLRTDLLVIWPHPGGVQRAVIELKLLRGALERTLAAGLEQTAAYMSRCGTDDGHLILFDRDPEKPWEEKIYRRRESHGSQEISVWGM